MAPQSRPPGPDPGSAFSSAAVGGWRMSAVVGKRTLALRQNSLMASQQMKRTAVAKVARRKRVSLREGDVFEIPLPDGRFGYGIVVKRGGLPGGGTPYIAIFRSVFDRRPDRSELTNDEVALQGWTTDALVYHNRWKIIEREAPVPPIQFPNFKVEREGKFYVVDVQGETIDLATPRELDLLNYRFSSTAGIFQDAFEALHGFGEWQDYFVKLMPAYAQSHVTRLAP